MAVPPSPYHWAATVWFLISPKGDWQEGLEATGVGPGTGTLKTGWPVFRGTTMKEKGSAEFRAPPRP